MSLAAPTTGYEWVGGQDARTKEQATVEAQSCFSKLHLAFGRFRFVVQTVESRNHVSVFDFSSLIGKGKECAGSDGDDFGRVVKVDTFAGKETIHHEAGRAVELVVALSGRPEKHGAIVGPYHFQLFHLFSLIQ